MNDNIDNYYADVNKNVISTLCQNSNIRNLINLSTQTDLYIFNKQHTKLKNKNELLKECKRKKKKELKESSIQLSNLAKLNKEHNNEDIKNIYVNLENNITKIDEVISCIQDIDTTQTNKSKIILSDFNKYDFIEYYSN